MHVNANAHAGSTGDQDGTNNVAQDTLYTYINWHARARKRAACVCVSGWNLSHGKRVSWDPTPSVLQIQKVNELKGNKAAQPALLHSMADSVDSKDTINEDGTDTSNVKALQTDQDTKCGGPTPANSDGDSTTIAAQEQPDQSSSALNATSCPSAAKTIGCAGDQDGANDDKVAQES